MNLLFEEILSSASLLVATTIEKPRAQNAHATSRREVLHVFPKHSFHATAFASLEFTLFKYVFFNREFLIRARAHRGEFR